jgi:diguanylate cyclase (GGDEF)-like protein
VTGDSRKTIQFGEGLAGRVANSREPLLVTGELFDTKRSDETDTETSPHSVMCVPLIHRDVLLGVLQVDAAREREYTQHDLRALSLFAEQAASAIANAQLYEEQRLTASRSAYQALHDTLTSLPNRVYFLDRLEQALERQQFSDEKVALLFIDIDDFKDVNDSLGHFAGDEVLMELGRRMRSCLRATDTAARLGGDEFAVLEEGIHCAGDAVATAERLHNRLSEPFFTSIQEEPIRLSLSVGIALEGTGGKTGTELLRNANTAMRNAKRSEKNGTTVVFDENVKMGAFYKIDLESELHGALERREFELTYQPIFSLESGQIVALETLVRWRHPERGVMPASAFIGIAEQSGLIGDIDRWVFARACETITELVTETYPSLDIHLNLLPSRLGDPQTANDLGDALGISGIDPQRVVLEVSENAALAAIHKSRTTFNAFKALGIRIALDDFGTGYSSLTYLNRFPVDVIKIHRLFVSGITESLGEADLAKAIISLGTSLNISVIAQGIEREEQLSRLQQMECPFGQGTYLSEPMLFESLDKLLRSRGTISFLHSHASTVA